MNEHPTDVPDVLIRQPRVKAIEPDPLRVGAAVSSHQRRECRAGNCLGCGTEVAWEAMVSSDNCGEMHLGSVASLRRSQDSGVQQ